jgi:hypothetical protein
MGLGNEGIGPDGAHEWRILLPEKISKLGFSPPLLYSRHLHQDEGETMKTVLKSRR